MRTMLLLIALLSPAVAYGQAPPAPPAPAPLVPPAPPAATTRLAPPVELIPGQLVRVPGHAETYVVDQNGSIRVASQTESAAPSIADQAIERTGKLAGLAVLLTMIATWALRNQKLLQGWFKDPTASRLVPLGLGAVGAVASSWLAGTSLSESIAIFAAGGLGSIGTHQVTSGVVRTVRARVATAPAPAAPPTVELVAEPPPEAPVVTEPPAT